ncbi:tRNA (adenosine(37)-N6)-threonylcarbamoyltransferase complex ATPase subunit type 1 TsaE [Ponticaulis profundi]|uniref:tRNA threonylcarbamoyladenosine biosynthesis protein TsaE n=1 Tax=Ponticaulis profundi TaxID=2665222 RepID=A0ABW1S9M8_9PROT
MKLAGEAETRAFGAKLATLLQPGDVVALYGDLGRGKTTLSRGLIRSLTGPEQDVPSPTYTLVQTYDVGDETIWHFDLYRVEHPDEVIELGFEDALNDICLIEWPEKAGRYLPEDRLSIEISGDGETRTLALLPGTPEWEVRLNGHFGNE